MINEIKQSHKSSLPAPTMLLSGHTGGPVYSTTFHPEGRLAATAGHDRLIFIWQIGEKCSNTSILKDHQNAVLQVVWTNSGDHILSCGADNNAVVWDAKSMKKIKRVKAHNSIINAISPSSTGTQLFLTASNDKTAKLWDLRKKHPVSTFKHTHAVTAAALGNLNTVTGGIDGKVMVWERRKPKKAFELIGHNDMICSLNFNSTENNLLSSSFDGTAKTWDLSPYSDSPQRFLKGYAVPSGGMESFLVRSNWGRNNEYIASGSSDGCSYLYDRDSGRLCYRLTGHNGTCTEVQIFGRLVLSSGADGKVFLGEL